MSNHLGDTNKMVSDTPRMKAAVMAAMEHGTGNVYRVGCDIERELNAANQRIKRLEEGGNALVAHVYNYRTQRHWTAESYQDLIQTIADWDQAKATKP